MLCFILGCSTESEICAPNTASNKWTVIFYSSSAPVNLPSGHHRKWRSEQSESGALTWWNIASMFTMTATRSGRNLVKTTKRELVWSGQQIVKWWSLLLCRTVKNHTNFPWFVRMVNPWWGVNHVLPWWSDSFWTEGALHANPFSTMSSMKTL